MKQAKLWGKNKLYVPGGAAFLCNKATMQRYGKVDIQQMHALLWSSQ